ncbi:MAG: MrcB family domain-containing protein [Haemophilus parainfluenzae]|uniref:MrcB family domain-containing protein n=1 Tax=Haemophilus parainfluenzae TaxID=729 RepID=UPI0018A68AF4|nr:DUF3578 domain-containing protein [Haemophilus parainfluenzae]QOR20981.1 DUF3578 domain-containing protein [Haemophilus parainfluenzae]
MSLREGLLKVLNNYLDIKKQPFKKENYEPIFYALIADIKNNFSGKNYSIKSHPGQGGWASVPWIEISKRKDVYVTYLFKADCSGVYLSLQQKADGMSKSKLIETTSKLRNSIKNISNYNEFTFDEIDLGKGVSGSAVKYNYSNIISKYYSKEMLPSNDVIKSELYQLLDIYDEWQLNGDFNDTSDSKVDREMNIIRLSKPFLILAGISGTGKTRFVRQQAERTGLDNYCLVSVRPDWHEPSDLLGYISHLGSQPKYITTDVLRFIVQAWKHISDSGFDLKTGKVTEEQLNEIQPYWLCLDEMNLAPVEQYFSDYLSILETRQWNGEVYQCDPLLKASALENIQPTDLGLSEGDILWEYFKENGISIPFNLIVAGTVNMDETTHGFSRKVLDRALSFDFNEFYPNDFNAYLSSNTQNKTFTYPIYSDASLSLNLDSPFVKESCEFLSEVNSVLKNSPFELAYRALNELLLSVKCINPKNEIDLQSVWDDFLMMKVLPRIEGDSEKLDFDGEESLLTNLEAIMREQLSAIWDGEKRIDLFRETNEGYVINIECRSKAKISWMQTKLEKFGFTHFWK